TLAHPHAADLRVEVDVHLVLEDGHLVGRQVRQQPPQRSQFACPAWILAAQDRTGPSPDQVGLVQPATDGLPADDQLVVGQQQHDDGGAGPATAQEAEVARRTLGDPADGQAGPESGEPGASAGWPAEEGLQTGLLVTLLPAGDGAGAGKQHRGDRVPGKAVRQQQEEVGTVGNRGVWAVAVQVQQGLAFMGSERDSTGHGLVSKVPWLVVHHSPYNHVFFVFKGPHTEKATLAFAIAWKNLAHEITSGPSGVLASSHFRSRRMTAPSEDRRIECYRYSATVRQVHERPPLADRSRRDHE